MPRPSLPRHERTASFPSTAPARGQPRPHTCHRCPSRDVRALCSGASGLTEGCALRSEGLSPPSGTYRPQAGPPDHQVLVPPQQGREDGWQGHLTVSGSTQAKPGGEVDSPPPPLGASGSAKLGGKDPTRAPCVHPSRVSMPPSPRVLGLASAPHPRAAPHLLPTCVRTLTRILPAPFASLVFSCLLMSCRAKQLQSRFLLWINKYRKLADVFCRCTSQK